MNARGGESDTTAQETDVAVQATIKVVNVTRRVFWDLCWLWATIAAVVALLRLVAHDQHLCLIAANSFSTYLYAPALLVFALAIWQRRTRLAALCFGLVVCHAVWIWPDYLPLVAKRHDTLHADNRPLLRVFSSNVHCRNANQSSMLAEIHAADADIVLLQEYSSIWHRALAASRFETKYPHRLIDLRDDAFGIAIYSKRPFEDQQLWFCDRIPIAEVIVRHAGQNVRIINWHPLPPRTLEYVAQWRQQYDSLFAKLGEIDQPTLIVGDFNATQHAQQMTRFAKFGFHSAHEAVGRGYAVTWPNRLAILPPIRLDHVFMSRHFRCNSVTEGTGQGSDHKPLIAEFVLVSDDR